MEHVKKNQKFDFMLKIIIIGDSGVGKTNLITRFCEDHFKQSYVATIGVDFKIKTITMDSKRYKMQIWDTAGQQRFKNITQTYYKGAAGIILTYSIIDRISFENIEKWITQIQSNAPTDVNKVLIATKSDLNAQRNVTTQQGMNLAKKFGMIFTQVSAKTGSHVNQGFQMLVKEIHKKYQQKGEFEGLVSKRQIMIGKKQSQDQRKQCSC